MRPLLLAFCCVSCLAVSGCGIKGSLYLPKEPAQSVKEPAQSAEEAAQTDEEPALSAPEQTDAPEQTTAP